MTLNILQTGASQLGLDLTTGQLEQFAAYYRELVDWNSRVNLTSITGYKEVQVVHFLDSLSVIQAFKANDKSPRIIDVGSGAGLPGLPLKIIYPAIKLTLLEATAKKTAFLNHLVSELGLGDVEIITGRAEEIAHKMEYREVFDIVLSRGVAPLATLAELTLPFCAVGGLFVSQKKGDIQDELKDSQAAISLLGGKIKKILDFRLDGLDDERKLVVIEKVSPTPPKYPRRPGMPAKRPLR